MIMIGSGDIFFLILICIVFYTYVGYPILLWLISRIKSQHGNAENSNAQIPSITLFVTAYNEAEFVVQKMENLLALNYPKNKIKYLWVIDGSNDNSNKLLQQYAVDILFKPERKGKVNAMNRGMLTVNTDLVVFSDANAMLHPDTLMHLVESFDNKEVGCVAGEKRILTTKNDNAAASGEGLYWKYEGEIKRLESEVGSCIGAAGELFAIRTNLYKPIDSNTILDDFEISMRIAMQGFKVDYNEHAIASEYASLNINEEMKRKVRIASGSFQSLFRMYALFNVFKYGGLTFQYVSHKVFRWVFTPLALVLLFGINLNALFHNEGSMLLLYASIMLVQLLWYFIAFFGWAVKDKKHIPSRVFIPFYFFLANFAMFKGFARYLMGKQQVNWEKSKRAS